MYYPHGMAERTDVLNHLLALTMLFDKDMRRAFEKARLTAARTHLLWELGRLGPSTQNALAKALDVSPRNVTLLVDKLEELGYVARNPHPSDRRATLVTLTDRGTHVMARMAKEHHLLASELTSGFSDTDVERLAQDLARIEARLRQLIDADKERRT